jgi:NitT/TauT family transport system substrate-binding protein
MARINGARILLAVLLILGLARPSFADDKMAISLNWVAGGDHSPYYYAKQAGWYKDAGIDLDIQQGRGSAVAAQRVAAGAAPLGLVDMGVVLDARGKGADLVAVMNIYANSAQGLYWLKSSGIKGPKDLAGKRLGSPPGDSVRVMWPAFAKANGLDPTSVTWVNIDANAKLAALKSHAIDATTSFFNIHHIFARELGSDMGFVRWGDAGVQQYSNSIVVNGAYLKTHEDAVARFVRVTQRAFAFCVQTPEPCVHALVAANGALQYDNELMNWRLVEVLMSDPISRSVALGWMDDARMEHDYKLTDEYLHIDKPYDVKDAYTDRFLDTSIKMTDVAMPQF